VAQDLPPYCVAAGNPARIVRMRFPDDHVARLLRIAWWTWPRELVTRHIKLIMGDDLDALEAAAPVREAP
jgi:virginiamycin A acetyltransferase